MSGKHDLVLLTHAYPFGKQAETFLETEIEVLAQRFARILVLPTLRGGGSRPLPANAELVEMDWLEEPSPQAKLAALVSREAVKVLLETRRSGTSLRPHRRVSRMYLDILGRNVLKYRALLRFVCERGLRDAIFYDYWFENSTLALALLRRSRMITLAIARAHNFDLYDERWFGRPVPFRDVKGRSLDAVFPISAHGAAYLRERVPSLRGKVRVARLGVGDPGRVATRADPVKPTVVTCSSLTPVKRVHLVPHVLEHLGGPVHWVHLGDGPERARVEDAAAARLTGEATWELLGHVDNHAVLDYYASHGVDVLLSVSSLEGIPVAMMEAQSFGIPIVGCDVGAVGEIIEEATGILLHRAATPVQMAEGLRAALEPGRFDRDAVQASYRARFEATGNYNRFADALIALRDGAAAPQEMHS